MTNINRLIIHDEAEISRKRKLKIKCTHVFFSINK